MSYTKLDLLQDLADMGLTGQETILIHSSLKSIGPVDGGADTVLDALMEFFRPGLLLLPTHTWRTINAATSPTPRTKSLLPAARLWRRSLP